MGFLDALFGKKKTTGFTPQFKDEFKSDESFNDLIEKRERILKELKDVLLDEAIVLNNRWYAKEISDDEYKEFFRGIIEREIELKEMYVDANIKYTDIDFSSLPIKDQPIEFSVEIEESWHVPIEKREIRKELGKEREELYYDQKIITNNFNANKVSLEDSNLEMNRWYEKEKLLIAKFLENGIEYKPIFEYWKSKAKV